MKVFGIIESICFLYVLFYNRMYFCINHFFLLINFLFFQGFKIFFFTVGGIYLLYLIYLVVRAYAELRSMPYFGKSLSNAVFIYIIDEFST